VRREFEMSEEDHDKIMDACKPVPLILIGGVEPRSAQENANSAWDRLGERMGFVGETVEGVEGKSTRFFTAEEG